MISRSSSVEKGRVISRRLFILVSAKIALLTGVTSRLYNLQISDKEKCRRANYVIETGLGKAYTFRRLTRLVKHLRLVSRRM